MLLEVSIAAATAIVGYDLLQNEQMASAGYPRTLVAAGLAGSAAGGDTLLEVYVGTQLVAKLYNQTTGFPGRDQMKRIGVSVPAGARIFAKVTDAPATNPINLAVDLNP